MPIFFHGLFENENLDQKIEIGDGECILNTIIMVYTY